MTNFDIQKTDTYTYGRKIQLLAQQVICNLKNVNVIEDQGQYNYKTMLYNFKTSDNIKYTSRGDKKSTQTGNFYVEYKQKINLYDWKKSGIWESEANYWMFYSQGFFYVIQLDELIELVSTQTYRRGRGGTNTNETHGFLVPIRDMSEKAECLDISQYIDDFDEQNYRY